MLSIRIIQTPANIDRLRERGPAIIDLLLETMTLDMFKLQSEIVGVQIPEKFPNGAPNIASTVRAIPAELQGTKIVGSVEAGGPRTTKRTLKSGAEVDYSAVQELGISHSYEILPFNKKALAFTMGGIETLFGDLNVDTTNKVVVRRVIHPGLTPRPYMSDGLSAMADEIVADLRAALQEALA